MFSPLVHVSVKVLFVQPGSPAPRPKTRGTTTISSQMGAFPEKSDNHKCFSLLVHVAARPLFVQPGFAAPSPKLREITTVSYQIKPLSNSWQAFLLWGGSFPGKCDRHTCSSLLVLSLFCSYNLALRHQVPNPRLFCANQLSICATVSSQMEALFNKWQAHSTYCGKFSRKIWQP